MGYKQKYTPNLNVPAQRGWCLKYIDDAGKAPKRTPSAQAACNVEKAAKRLKSPTIATPVGIWAVGFLQFTRGQYTSLGHVFFIKNLGGGRYDIRDSETRSGARKPYGSINELLAWFGAYAPRYTGWSGTCDGRQYIETVAVPKPPVKKSNDTIANEVIASKWGNGPVRVAKLKKASYNPATIQALVNKKLR